MALGSPDATVRFHHPLAFWLGTAAVIFGVIAHFPMYMESAATDYRMVGMKIGPLMHTGMFFIIFGIISVAYSLVTPGLKARRAVLADNDIQIRAMDDARLTPTHWKLFIVLVIALIVDVMKPATLGFVLPGTAEEYGLSKAQAAIMPVAGIFGTVIGSFLWGWAGDAIGRRASILLAAIVFIGTSICGAMPSYAWNVFMCFLMGVGAGGMLPITFALLAEIAPVRRRGFMIVLLGGLGTVGGYLAASGLAALLEPTFGWRVMWLIGLPTGAALILLNRYIPESPRFLLAQGREAEAERIMRSFGVEAARSPALLQESTHARAETQGEKMKEMFRGRVAPLTYALGLYGLAWGLVNFGFLLWLPLNLREAGLGVGASDALLAKSALIAFPSTLIAAFLYHAWSAKRTMVVYAMLTVASLAGFAYMGDNLTQYPLIMTVMIVALLAASSGVVAMLSPYTAEVFPLQIRATGSGWSAGCSKAAGVATLSAAVAGFTPGIAVGALFAAAPTALAAFFVYVAGVETRGVGLEAIEARPRPAAKKNL